MLKKIPSSSKYDIFTILDIICLLVGVFCGGVQKSIHAQIKILKTKTSTKHNL